MTSCGYYRTVLPITHIGRDLADSGISLVASTRLDESDRHDCYIFGRVPDYATAIFARKVKRRGAKIVWDFDDSFWDIPEGSPVKELFGGPSIDALEDSLLMADRVTVSTKHLAEVAVGHCPFLAGNITVLENLIWSAPYFRNGRAENLTKILWTGSHTHIVDIGPVYAVAEYVAATPNHVLIMYGFIPDDLKNAPNVIHVPWGAKKNYESILSLIAPDVALLPLADNQFNRCKSAIKFFECAMAGALCIASDIPPFADVVEDLVSGVLLPNNDSSQWIETLREMKGLEELDIKDMRTNAKRHIMQEFSWDYDSPKRRAWRDFYLSLKDV